MTGGNTQRNQVGQSFLPAKSGTESTVLQTQRVTNQATQPNNAYMIANLHANVTLTSGPPLVYTGVFWDVQTDLIKLNLASPFISFNLFTGIWDIQIFVVWGATSDGNPMRISCNMPSNFSSGSYTQYTPSNCSMIFRQQFIVQDPTVAKAAQYGFGGIGFYYQSTTAGATVSTLNAQMIIAKMS